MLTIIFNTIEYDLKDRPNVSASRFQASLTRAHSIDEIVEEVSNTSTIIIKDNGITTAVYEGYTKMLAVAVYEDVISVELINEDIQMQIDSLGRAVDNLSDNQEMQEGEISNLNNQVSELTPYKAIKTASKDDTELVFENAPAGNLSVLAEDSEGNLVSFEAERQDNDVVIIFDEPLAYATTVTISII